MDPTYSIDQCYKVNRDNYHSDDVPSYPVWDLDPYPIKFPTSQCSEGIEIIITPTKPIKPIEPIDCNCDLKNKSALPAIFILSLLVGLIVLAKN